MISFLIRKMWKNKWLVLSLLIGNILLVGIVSSTPLYTQATMQRILQKNLQQFQLDNDVYPSIVELSYIFNYVKADKIIGVYRDTRDRIVPESIEKLGIPVLSVVQRSSMDGWYCTPYIPREDRPRSRQLNIVAFEGYEAHIQLTQGRMPSETVVDGNVIECLANEATLLKQDLLLDELLAVSNLDEDNPYYIKIVGVFEAKDEADLYWTVNPNTYNTTVLTSDALIKDHFIENYVPEYRVTTNWIIMLDYKQMVVSDVPRYVQTDQELQARFNGGDRIWSYKENFMGTIQQFSLKTDKLVVTLWVLQLPIYVLLAFYIFMVSKQILSLEQNDISVLKSRGASRSQLFTLYLLQSVFVALVSVAVGIPLGVTICRMLGASSGFLVMVQRAALQVDLNAEAFIYSGIAVLFSMITMLAPVIRFSRVTIVDYKRSKSGRLKKSLWQRTYLDILCLGVACYGLYSFNSRREMMALMNTEVQSVDPLLYLSSSLFIIGLGLLCLRLFPYLVKLIFWIGKKLWSPALYASLVRVVRSAGEEQFIMIFLVLTLAVGIFAAKSARTVNHNEEQIIQYLNGADLIFAEKWNPDIASNPLDPHEVVYTEPDFERFTHFDEVDAVSKVFVSSVGQLRKGSSSLDKVKIMAIETDTFGQTLWFRDDLLPIHINYFLNAMAQRMDGVLLSDNFRTKLGYQVGDLVNYGRYDTDLQGVVVGFVNYWPGYAPVQATTTKGGETVQEDNYLIIGHMSYMYNTWGMQPYQVWMKTNTPTNNFFYDFVEETGLRLTSFYNTKGDLVEIKSDPILQGTNGILTVGFIVTLLVCFTGFLIFWILSIKSRVLQFGIFRAMGMSMRNILQMLINEQILITLTAVLIGGAVGEISARLFVPLIQISFAASEQVIPLVVVTDPRDYTNIYLTIGTMIIVCLSVLGVLISKIKIAQALKLGED